MFSLAYLTIFLKHISNVALMREFLHYLMQGRYDNKPILNTLVQNISSTNHLVRPTRVGGVGGGGQAPLPPTMEPRCSCACCLCRCVQ